MADISKITLPNGDSYNIKDAVARKGQAIYYATCSTAAGTAAKVATTTDGDFTLETGAIVMVKFTNASTYNGTSTLNVDSTGAKQIYYVNATAATRYMWYTGEVVTFVYDGTHFVINEGSVATTTYYGVTKLSSATNSTSEVLAATPKAVKTAYDLANAAAPQSTTYTKTEVDDLIGDAVDFGTVGSEGNPVYFSNGTPTPGAFSWGTDEDQNVVVSWDGETPEITPSGTALAISSGGTGATTAAGARTNLGLGSAATYSVTSTVNDDENLITGGAAKRYIDSVATYPNVVFRGQFTGDIDSLTIDDGEWILYGSETYTHQSMDDQGVGSPTFSTFIQYSATNTSSYSGLVKTQVIYTPAMMYVRKYGGTGTAVWSNWNVFKSTEASVYSSGLMSADDKTKVTNTNIFYGTCSTAAGTAAKVVALTNGTQFELIAGAIVGVRFSATNTADNVTLNVNSTGAKQIYYAQSPYTGHVEQITGYANRVIYYMYNGSYWVYMGSSTANAVTLEGVLAIEHGGTAATSASAARENLGLGNVENKSSATIRGELTSSDVTSALGFTPPQTDTNNRRSFFGTCSTAASDSVKEVVLSDVTGWELIPGIIVGVKFSVSNTASNCSLNVNGSGAKQVWYNNAVNTGTDTGIFGYKNRCVFYMYDGEHWVFINQGANLNNNTNTVPSAYCETAAATAAKAAICTNYTLTANTHLHFIIRYANTVAGAITMNVNSKGAKPIYINGTASSSSNYTLPAGSYIAFYNGTYWDFRTDGIIPRTTLTKTVTGTTSSTGAIDSGLAQNTYSILGTRSTGTNNHFAFIRGDNYLTVFTVTNNVMTILPNTSVSFEVFYSAK